MKRLHARWLIATSIAVLISSCTADAPEPQAAPCSQPPAAAFAGMAADARAVAEWGYQLYGGWVLPVNRTMEMAVQVTANYGLGTFIYSRVGHPGGYFGYTAYLAVSPEQKQAIAMLIVGNVSSDAANSLMVQLDEAAR
jgi:hypothetical protein